MLSSPYEQPISITEYELAEFDIVDNVIEASIIMGDPERAFEYGISIKRSAAIKSYALAKLLYKLRDTWHNYHIEGEFEDVVYERMGTPKETTKKYVRMWENIFANQDIPESTKRILMGRPIRDTLLLTAAAKEGMTLEELRNAALASDHASLRDMIATARGAQTSSSNALRLYVVTREDHSQYPPGTLLCKRGSGVYKPMGLFSIEDSDEDVQQAIARYLNSTGTQEI